MRKRTNFGLWSASMIAAVAGGASIAAAQDCRLGVHAADPVLMPGETSPVYVMAHFPAAGFAFAAAQFDVRAGMPSWAAASAGVIAGGDVLGIAASQAHAPHVGIVADPANPRRIWNGIFAPDSYEPALVRIQATPTGFAYYPSELTPSSVECDAGRGRDWVLVNPMVFGPALGAPAPGTTMEPARGGRDVLIGGLGTDRLYGLLVPAARRVRMGSDTPPDSLAIEVSPEPAAGDPVPTDQFSLNFTKVVFQYQPSASWPSAHSGGVNVLMADGSVRFLSSGVSGPLPFDLPRLPDTYRFRVEADEVNVRTTVIAELGFDQPVLVDLPNQSGASVRRLEIHKTANNLHQIGLAVQSYETHGAPQLWLAFEGACPADANSDGAVNSADISHFLTAWLLSVQGGTLGADFSGDGQVNSTDISAFLAAWLAAVQGGGC